MIDGFRDRLDAAGQLADALGAYRGTHPLVLAIPRGAVPLGRELATRLEGELDVVLVRKLCAPASPELAVGAVDESGWTYVAPFAGQAGADAAYLNAETTRQRAALQQRRALYSPARPALDARGRVVIVVDDGAATGATMLAALHAVRARGAARVVCALPVASLEAVALLGPHADDLVCLQVPAQFGAVGQFYDVFDQVGDDEVLRVLGQHQTAGPA